MDVEVKHLVLRKETYYFRRRLKDSEVMLSLKTSNLKKATSRCLLANDKLQSLIETGKINMIPLHEIRRIVADSLINKSLESHARRMANYGKICPDTVQDGVERSLRMEKHYEQEKNGENLLGKALAKDLLKNIEHDEGDLNLMAQEAILAMIFTTKMQRERIQGKSFLTEHNKAIYDEAMTGNYRTSDEIREAETVVTLKELIERYILEKKDNWKESTLKPTRTVLRQLLEHFSNTNIKAIKHRDMLDYRDNILCKLPKRTGNLSRFKNKKVQELVKVKGERIENKTINTQLGHINSFFLWCERHEYIERNPATGLKLKLSKKANEERSVYSTDDLERIFTLLREDKLHGWQQHKLWISLVGLYTGARQNEICQLQTDNIVVKDNIVCFEITDEVEGTSLKNAGSKRLVPISPVLLKLNFLDLVIKRKKIKLQGDGQNRFWHTLFYNPKFTYAHYFQKFFHNFNRKHVTTDSRKVFHSFRHNFCTALKNKGVQDSLISDLVGHVSSGETMGRYAKASDPQPLFKAISQLDYEFDIFKTLGVTPVSDEAIQEQISNL